MWVFNVLSFVLAWTWTASPGDYTNAGEVITLPTGATEVKIKPIGGYQIGGFGQPKIYCIGIEFKTQVQWVSMSYDPGGNRLADLIATSAEATTLWTGQPQPTLSLGSNRTLAWGMNDNVLTDNRNSAISFEIYYK